MDENLLILAIGYKGPLCILEGADQVTIYWEVRKVNERGGQYQNIPRKNSKYKVYRWK